MILINGEIKKTVAADDRGLMYGDGLFETIEICRGMPVLLQQHIDRLQSGCARLGLVMPAADLLKNEIHQLCEYQNKGIVKITLTRGSGGRGYRPAENSESLRILSFHDWPEIPDCYYTNGINLYNCKTDISTSRSLSGLKTLCRLDQVLAQREWSETEFAEGLMSDSAGHVIEGTKSNLFIIVNGDLYTPSLKMGGVKGVMREKVIALAQQSGLLVHKTEMKADFVKQADELFVCNSIIHIWPVRQYAKKKYEVGKITGQLMTLLASSLDQDFNGND